MNENKPDVFYIFSYGYRAQSTVICSTLLKWIGVRSPGKLQIERGSTPETV